MKFETSSHTGTRRTGVAARVALGAALLAVAPAASAQSGGHLRVGVERAFGFTYNALTISSESTTGSVTTTREQALTWTTFNLFGSGFSGVNVGTTGVITSALVPRLAVDYELANHVTLGAAAFFSYNSLSDDGGAGLTSVGVGLAPRVGYSLGLSERVAFWPRAGFTLAYTSTSPQSGSATVTTTSSSSYFPVWINLEPTLVFAVDPHVLFTLGLVCDIPVAGAVTTKSRSTVGGVTVERTAENSLTQLIVAAQFGLTARF